MAQLYGLMADKQSMKTLILIILLISSGSFAKSAKVTIMNKDGETKEYTFFEDKKLQPLNTFAPDFMSCDVSFDDSDRAFLSCSVEAADLKKQNKKRYFTTFSTLALCGSPFSGAMHIMTDSKPQGYVRYSILCNK